MQRSIAAAIMAFSFIATATPTFAIATSGPALAAGPVEASIVERKRETCWRTNRATKQRFRIC